MDTMTETNRSEIQFRWVLQGVLENSSPLAIGSGNARITDNDILKNAKGVPFIPATTFLGVLRHALRSAVDDASYQNLVARQFWGYTEGSAGQQSAVSAGDLFPESPDAIEITMRDGVKIDDKTGTALDKHKFDYEILEPGVRFPFRLEVTARSGHPAAKFERVLHTIAILLQSEGLQVGGKTTSGFGMLTTRELDVYTYDLTDATDIARWFENATTESHPITREQAYPLDKQADCVLECRLGLVQSILVRSYPADPNEVDAVHITSRGTPIIPGPSWKGTIRARAARILNTLNPGKGSQLITALFGHEGQQETAAQKGYVSVTESELVNTTTAEQTRINIDRFTGGGIRGALFDTRPEFGTPDASHTTLRIRIRDYQQHPWAVGLLLHVIKDLWDEDVSVGGESSIGRGRMQGLQLQCSWDGKHVTLESDTDQGLTITPAKGQDQLEQFHTALMEEVNHGK